jgi:Xaa-Pro dipeptidase
LDCGSTFAGYRSDLSRATTIGPPPAAARRYLEAVAAIYDRCLPLLRPGVPGSVVAQEALSGAREAGLAGDLYRSPNHEAGFVAHGIGCSYHEPPELHPGSDVILAENMVIVLEPILCRRGALGVKIEDAVLITAQGPERLSQIPVRVWKE